MDTLASLRPAAMAYWSPSQVRSSVLSGQLTGSIGHTMARFFPSPAPDDLIVSTLLTRVLDAYWFTAM